MVQVLVHEMYGAAAELHAIFERLLLRLKPRKRGQQRRMNVQNLSRELLHEPRREQAHVSGEHHQVYPGIAKGRHYGAVVLLALAAFAGQHYGFQATRLRRR